MKLLVLEPNPEFGGGMEAVSLRLSKELARRGDTIVLVHDNDGDMLPAYRTFCTDIVKTPLTGFRRKEPIRTAHLLMRLHRIIRQHRIDACYTSHLGYLAIGALLKWMNGRAWHYHLGLLGTGRSAADHWALRHLGSGISPAPHTVDTWRAVGWPGETLHEVRNWVDGDDFRPAENRAALRRALGMPVDAFMVGFVGRIVKEKGVEVLIDAFNALPVENAVLVMAGRAEPEYVEALKRRCTRPNQLEVIARTARPQDIHAAADVTCVPSIWPEPFPLVVLEAMASGTPVICSDVGILPSVLGEDFADLVASRGSVESLTERLVAVYRDGFAGRGDALRARALSRYGPEEPVAAYRRIILGELSTMNGEYRL